jgi:mycoredoxin
MLSDSTITIKRETFRCVIGDLMDNEIIEVYGARWCGDCFRAKRIFDKHQIEYQWIDINKDSTAKEFVGQVNGGNFVVPTIVFSDGTILSEPSTRQLKQKLGLLENN